MPYKVKFLQNDLFAFDNMQFFWQAVRSEQTQPTTRLACSNGHECYRVGNDCKQFKLSHKPWVAGLNCGEWQYNKRNFTIKITIL